MSFSFPLDELRKSVPGAEALAELSGDALRAAVTGLLGALAEDAEVTLDGEMVTVTPRRVGPAAMVEANRLQEKAAARARQGEFAKAEGIYRRVLELNPLAMKARRELAMVLVEMGKPGDAVDLLIDVLRADPRDAQALIILGNHYARRGGDPVAARRFLARAAELTPEDPLVYNSLAALHFEAKEPEMSLGQFDRALALDAGLAQAHYGKSMVLMTEGRFVEALRALDTMFETGTTDEARSKPMLAAARDNYRKLSNLVANDRVSESFKVAEDLKAKAAAASGYPVMVEVAPLEGTLCGVTRMAWRFGRDSHLVTLNQKLPAEMVRNHILAHEVSHILMESEARAAGCNRWLRTDDMHLDAAVQQMHGEVQLISRKLRQDEKELRKLARRLVQDGLSLLFNGPLDILIERELAKTPALREAQYCSLFLQCHQAAQMGLNPENRSVVPPPLLRLNDAMNGAMALFVDELTKGATDFFDRWGGSPYAADAREIHAMCMQPTTGADWGFLLIDRAAQWLGVETWFSWKQDPGEFVIKDRAVQNPVEGTVNPALLKSKAPEAVPLLLAALRRFDGMELRAIAELTQEIALMGQEGISYSDAGRTYQLKKAPGESFSGLALMCLMYAGLQRLAPVEADTAMDLHEEFAMALSLYHSEKER